MKLYLVNGQSIISQDMCETDYLLQTFFSMGNKETELMNRFIERRGQENFILDSGAFSLFNGAKKLTYDDLKKYIDKYCNFILKYKIKQFLELDIDSMIGYDEVKKINRYIESKVGIKPIYVHHQFTRDFDELTKACKESDYIFYGGIAGIMKVDDEVVQSFVDYAFQYGTKVHMLGWTPLNMKIKNLYSADSSSWTMGGRAGIVYTFNRTYLENYSFKDKRRITFFELNNHNFNQWLKYQDYLKNQGWITS